MVNKICPTEQELDLLIAAATNADESAREASENKRLQGNALACGLLDALLLGSSDYRKALAEKANLLGAAPAKTYKNQLGRAKRVYNAIITSESGFLTVKKGKESFEYLIQRFYDEELSVLMDIRATADYLRKLEDEATQQDKLTMKYIDLACADSGVTTVKDVLKMSAKMQQFYIDKGKAIHDADNSPQAKIRAMLAELSKEERAELLKVA